MLTGENDRAQKTSNDYVWALKDINFDVASGEVLGIIGKNGSGKSTLLKMLSKVTSPTKGNIKVRGRIASLLEVGTGFHPELTGRENIFLNGAILGMTKVEIRAKFDEIVAFSGVEKYIDTPVKRYSSGMYVRLAFAVAAHLEPEILIVDEVLAVGDADFQKKCLGKMKDVSGEGRTVLFVSHNMAAVKSLCTKGILLGNGKVTQQGNIDFCVSRYLSGNSDSLNYKNFGIEYDFENFKLNEISIRPKGLTYHETLTEYQEIELELKINIKRNAEKLKVTFVLKSESGEALFAFSNEGFASLLNGLNELVCVFPKGYLNVGSYFLDIYIIAESKVTIYADSDILNFIVEEGQRTLGSWMGKEPGFIKPIFNWFNK
jgi:lipopolysaccharide transport system ATP-binding protein